MFYDPLQEVIGHFGICTRMVVVDCQWVVPFSSYSHQVCQITSSRRACNCREELFSVDTISDACKGHKTQQQGLRAGPCYPFWRPFLFQLHHLVNCQSSWFQTNFKKPFWCLLVDRKQKRIKGKVTQLFLGKTSFPLIKVIKLILQEVQYNKIDIFFFIGHILNLDLFPRLVLCVAKKPCANV